MKNNKKILFLGELPPNVIHGISLSNDRILNALSTCFTIIKVEDRSSFGSVFSSILSASVSLLKLIGLSKNTVDIFYVNTPMSRLGLWKVLIAVRLVRLCSPTVKVVSHLHRGDFTVFIDIKKNRELFILFSKYIDRILVLSERSVVELDVSNTLDLSKVRVLHNTIMPLAEKDDILINNNRLLLERNYYCLCNYIESKRIHSLVSVVNQLLLSQVDFNGAASNEQYMNTLKERDIGSICNFNGIIRGTEKEQKLNKAKALILPSLNEGMPLVILESLAQGTPVICYNIGYISDYLGEDYPGLVQELNDEALKRKIQWMETLSNDEYESLRLLSFNIFWDRFSPHKINESTLYIFNNL